MAELLNHVAFGGKRFTLTRNGNGVAVIISLKDWQSFEQLLKRLEDEEDIRDADEAMARIKKEGTISRDEVKRKLGL